MKKVIAIMLDLVLVLSLLGCGNKIAEKEYIATPPKSEQEIELEKEVEKASGEQLKNEKSTQNDKASPLQADLYAQVKSLMDSFRLYSNAYYKVGDSNKNPLIWDGACLGNPINENTVIAFTDEKLQDGGVCFELSRQAYGASNDLTIICHSTDVVGRVYVKIHGIVDLYSQEKQATVATTFDNVEFCFNDVNTYVNLQALSEYQAVESQDLDNDGLVESYAYYWKNNKCLMTIYDFIDGTVVATDLSELFDQSVSFSACADCANIKDEYVKCFFVVTDDSKTSGVYSYSDGELTKECDYDTNQYLGPLI